MSSCVTVCNCVCVTAFDNAAVCGGVIACDCAAV